MLTVTVPLTVAALMGLVMAAAMALLTVTTMLWVPWLLLPSVTVSRSVCGPLLTFTRLQLYVSVLPAVQGLKIWLPSFFRLNVLDVGVVLIVTAMLTVVEPATVALLAGAVIEAVRPPPLFTVTLMVAVSLASAESVTVRERVCAVLVYVVVFQL